MMIDHGDEMQKKIVKIRDPASFTNEQALRKKLCKFKNCDKKRYAGAA